MKKTLTILSFLLVLNFTASSQDSIHTEVVEVIKKHGLENSEVMEIASWICDIYGPRLTGSPNLDKATDWVITTLENWGLENVNKHEWGPFGRGWELQHFYMESTAPNPFPIIAYPKAWSSSSGEMEGEVVIMNLGGDSKLEDYKGKLAGKFVFLDDIRPITEHFSPQANRLTEETLLNRANASQPRYRPFRYLNFSRALRNQTKTLWEFLYEEKPLAVIDRSAKGDYGTVFVAQANAPLGNVREHGFDVLPQVTMSVEQYNRIHRMIQKGLDVKLKMNQNDLPT